MRGEERWWREAEVATSEEFILETYDNYMIYITYDIIFLWFGGGGNQWKICIRNIGYKIYVTYDIIYI